MDQVIKKVQNNLAQKEILILEAQCLEEKAQALRNKVKANDLITEIKDIQKEILSMYERYELLKQLVNLAVKSFGTSIEFIPISLDDYQNCFFNGKSIETIERELVFITERIIFLNELLSKICNYIGHDYRFVEIDNVFDFSSLEISLEERYICCCAICGSSIALEEKDGCVKSEADERVKKLRMARKIKFYQSPFKVFDVLDKDFYDKRL